MRHPMFRETGYFTPGDLRFERLSQGIIFASMVVLSLSTMTSLPQGTRITLLVLDAIFGACFAIEYGLRIYFAKDRLKYIFSFWGIVDFIAIVPSLFFAGTNLKALRALRLLRLIRLLKLARTSAALQRLGRAFEKVKYEFAVFGLLSALVFYVAAVGIYTFENEAQPDTFSSIPAAMWWAVATLTTVGYGDVYPITAAGRIFTGLVLLVGLGLVAVPTGLIAAALQEEHGTDETTPSGQGNPPRQPPADNNQP